MRNYLSKFIARIRRIFWRGSEVDESYFGGRRKGKRGRGAAGKVPVFGLLKRGRQGLHKDNT